MSSYHDTELAKRLKILRAAAKPYPTVVAELASFENHLRYLDTVVSAQDALRAAEAELALELGKYDHAATLATLIWNTNTRNALYSQAQRMRGPLVDEATERFAENEVMEREVLA